MTHIFIKDVDNRTCVISQKEMIKSMTDNAGLLYGHTLPEIFKMIKLHPELLWFVQNIFNAIETDMLTLDSPTDETLSNLLSKGRQALAKAKGES